MHTMGKPTEANGCGFALAWIIGVPLVVALIAGGDGGWIIAGLGAAAFALIVFVTLAEMWPSRRRR